MSSKKLVSSGQEPEGGMAGKEARGALKGKALVEWRQQQVALGLLAHKSVREIHAELVTLAGKGVGKKCSPATVGRDAQAVRSAWVETRRNAAEEVVAEDLARLKEMERRWWVKANSDDGDAGEASERVLAIMRQRAALLGLGSGGRGAVQVTAGAMAAGASGGNENGPLPAGAQVKVLVEYVDDRRDLGKLSYQTSDAPAGPVTGDRLNGRRLI